MFSIIRLDDNEGITEWAIKKRWFRRVWCVYVRQSSTTEPVLGSRRGYKWRASFNTSEDAALWIGAQTNATSAPRPNLTSCSGVNFSAHSAREPSRFANAEPGM